VILSFQEGLEPTRPAAQIDGVIRQAYLPITNAREWTVDQQRTMHEAQFQLVLGCMRRAGFEYPSEPFAPFTLSIDRRYGLTDLEAARKWGYGLPPGAIVDDSAMRAYLDSLSPVEREAFEVAASGTTSSDGQGGCLGEARDTIYGSRARSLRAEELRQTSQDLEIQAYFAAEGDQRVQRATALWTGCMEKRGYEVSDLADPWDASVLVTGPPGGPEDIALAVTVVRCNDATDLVETWSGVEAEIQGQLFEEHRAPLQELMSLREQAFENALEIVSD
jgi:hypothetical protein